MEAVERVSDIYERNPWRGLDFRYRLEPIAPLVARDTLERIRRTAAEAGYLS